MKDKCIIITRRKEDYENFLDEDAKEAKCMKCKKTVIYGDITYRHAEKEKAKKKAKSIEFLCNICYKEMPKFGKLIRPNQEMLDRMRADGMDIDEIKIRKMMHAIKHKRGI